MVISAKEKIKQKKKKRLGIVFGESIERRGL